MRYRVIVQSRIQGTDEVMGEPVKVFTYADPGRAESVCNALAETLRALAMLASFMISVDELQTGRILRRERV